MKKNKLYDVEKSPFYRLRSKHKLARLLEFNIVDLAYYQSDDRFLVYVDKSTGRLIQTPIGELRKIHDKFHKILSRIQLPQWLISSCKGKSHLDNYKFHIGNRFVAKVDVKSFFKSCKAEYVFRFFKYKLNMSDDVARVCTNLICVSGGVPTGSPVSQLIAFFANEDIFTKIVQIAHESELSVSLVVDDFTLSGDKPICRNFLWSIDKILRKHGHKLNSSKTKRYGPQEFRLITGVSLSSEGRAFVPNEIRHKLWAISSNLSTLSNQQVRSAKGLTQYAVQIESGTYHNLHHRVSLLWKKLPKINPKKRKFRRRKVNTGEQRSGKKGEAGGSGGAC